MNHTTSVSPSWPDVQVHARRTGAGRPAVVLLHGWATTSAVWAPVLDRWPTTLGTAHALDLPGGGGSSRPGGYTLERWADSVTRYIQALPSPVVLVGHSMGGTIAQLVALSVPHHIHRLVLVSPVPACGVPLPDEAVAGFKALASSPIGRAGLLSSMMAASVDPAAFDAFATACESVSPAAFVEGLDAWRTADFAPALSGLTTPTRLLSGGAEQPLSPEHLAATVGQHIPHATHTVLPGVGHYPQYEAIERFMPLLVDAIDA